jgi:hypothetical protein
MAVKFPTFVPGTFYVINGVGAKMAGGKDFATLADAVKAAVSSTKRALSSARSHGASGFDVMEVIPGRHTCRAIVNLDLSVTYK